MVGAPVACQYGSKPLPKKNGGGMLIKCGKICDEGQTLCPYHIMIAEVKEKRKNERIDAQLAKKQAAHVKGRR